MIHPLVDNEQRRVHICQMRDGILGQHCHVIGVDQIRDTVIDFRIQMVRTACQNNAVTAGLLKEFDHFLTAFSDISPGLFELFPGCAHGSGDNR